MDSFVKQLVALFNEKGGSLYGGEAITQLQHGLQCATLAHQSGADPALICAALLHDVGHLLHTLPDDAPDMGIDDVHEQLATRYLGPHFPAEVTAPIALHVAAKRYLCATEPGYTESLSPTSVQSLALQGGVMTPDEVSRFEQNPWYKQAVQLRKWDDTGKDPDMETLPFLYFVPMLEYCTKKY